MKFLSATLSVAALLSSLLVSFPLLAASDQTRYVIDLSDQNLDLPKSFAETTPQGLSRLLQKTVDELGLGNGFVASLVRPFNDRSVVVNFAGIPDQALLNRLRSDPRVSGIYPDRRIYAHDQGPVVGVLNGLTPSQRTRAWAHQSTTTQPAGLNTQGFWNQSHGSLGSVVAVVDTGVLYSHPFLQGHLLSGYDFVSSSFSGNDGQASSGSDRDGDPSDPGDGTSLLDLGVEDCGLLSASSWHGTFVSGLISANPQTSEGIFPVLYNNEILPVRVLGKCGGFSTDLADAIRWSAGLNVTGVPVNRRPARVINLSLGAEGECVNGIEGAAIRDAVNAGALVVVATGNDGSSVDSPANCAGALAVAATDQQGYKANYSNFGPEVALTAPGGDTAFPLWSSGNAGITGEAAHTYRNKIGSSFSSAFVSAAAGYLFGARPDLSVNEARDLILRSTRPFLAPSGPVCSGNLINTACQCTSATCGAGMLDMGLLASNASGNTQVNLFSEDGVAVEPGGQLRFTASDGRNSTFNFEILNVVADSSAPSPLLSVAGNTATVSLPTGVEGLVLRAVSPNGSSALAPVVALEPQFTLPSLIYGITDTLFSGAVATIGSPASSTNPNSSESSPQSSSSTSGGGGSSGGLLFLGALFILLFLNRKSSSGQVL